MPVKTLQTVENALTVLEVVAQFQPIGVSAVARHVEMDKNAVQRILITLGTAGWIRQKPTSTAWELTPRILGLASQVSPSLRTLAKPHLIELSNTSGETILLWQLDFVTTTNFATLIDCVESSQLLRMSVPIGTRMKMQSPALIENEFEKFLLHSPTGQRAWLDGHTAKHFFVTDHEYPNAVGLTSIIYDGPGQAVAAITIVGPRLRITPDRYETLGSLISTSARQISGL